MDAGAIQRFELAGVAGTARLEAIGPVADLHTVGYGQNALSTLQMLVENGGVTTIDASAWSMSQARAPVPHSLTLGQQLKQIAN